VARFRKEEGCARDFQASGGATQDLAVLERLCAQGMTPLLPEPAVVPLPSGVAEVPFKVGSAACLRAAVVAGPNASPTLSLVDPRGATLANAASNEAVGVVPTDGTVCVREIGTYRAVVRLSAGSSDAGAAMLQIWQASRD
jgi:hypothetical protein